MGAILTAEKTSADACSRSGAFALLLSGVLLLLIPYWLDRPNEIALGKYLTSRLNLAIDLQRLDDDPAWQKYQESRNVSTTLRHMTAEFSEFFLVSGMVC